MAIDRKAVIDLGHPAISGHFPGRPIVPGVLILQEVMAVAREALGERVAIVGLPIVKFLAPLTPGATLHIRVQAFAEGFLEFTCTAAGRQVATGKIGYQRP